MSRGPVDRRLLRHAGAARPFIRLTALIGTLSAVCLLGQAVIVASAVTDVFLDGAGLADIGGRLALLVGLVAARALLAHLHQVVADRAVASVAAQLRGAALRRAGELSDSALSTQLLTGGLDTLAPYFTRYLPQLVLVGTVVPLYVGAITVADWVSGLVVIGTLPVVPILMVLIGAATGQRARERHEVLHRLAHHFLDVVDGLATLRVFGRARVQRERIAAVTDEYRRSTLSVLRLSFLSTFVLEVAASLSVALVAVQIGLRLLDGSISLAAGLLVLLLAPEVYLPLRTLGASHHAAADGLHAARQVLDALDRPEPTAGTAPVPPIGRVGLEARDLAVAGEDGRAARLGPVSLRLRPGELLAVVGPSGSGKSTLLEVLAGARAPDGGTLRVDGTDLADADPGARRAQVAWMRQRPALLAGTVAENVALGAPGATAEEIREALDLAAAGGLDPGAVLGEGGSGLSAGERQRVALARAVLRARRGAGLVLLDEPTAHLDGKDEERVLEGLRTLLPGRCVVLVVHRPALAAAADRVVRLDAAPVAAVSR